MVEQWSSKSHAWVRFLLSLLLKSKSFKKKPQLNRPLRKFIKKRNNRLLSHLIKTRSKLLRKNIKYLQKFSALKYRNDCKSFVYFKKLPNFSIIIGAQRSYSKRKFYKYINYLFLNSVNSLKFEFFKDSINKHRIYYSNYLTFNQQLIMQKISYLLTFFLSINKSYNVHNRVFRLLDFYYFNNPITLSKLHNYYRKFLSNYETCNNIYFNVFNNNRKSKTNWQSRAKEAKSQSSLIGKHPQNFSINAPIINRFSKSFYFLLKKTLSSPCSSPSSRLKFLKNHSSRYFQSPYYSLTSLFFLTFNRKSLKRANNAFKLSRLDVLNEDTIYITRRTTNFNQSIYYKINFCKFSAKYENSLIQIPLLHHQYGTFLFFANNFSINDNLIESNYFFINFSKSRFLKTTKSLLPNKLSKFSKIFYRLRKFKRAIPQSLYFFKNASNQRNARSLNQYHNANLKLPKLLKNKTEPNSTTNKLSKLESVLNLFFKPLFFKTLLYVKSEISVKTLLLRNISYNFFKNLHNLFFYTPLHPLFSSNYIPNDNFSYIWKKKIIKIFEHSKFPTITTMWHYQTLIRFLEFCSGKKIYFRIHPFLVNHLDLQEKAQCLMWAQKVKYFRKVLGPRLFLNESLQILYLSLKLRDPYVLSNWMISTMQKISFWKFKTFLRYLKYVLRFFFMGIFSQLDVKGIKFQLKGKVSVAGNARTRTVFHTIGRTSHGTFNNKILYNLSLVKTFTGVMGLKLWIVF